MVSVVLLSQMFMSVQASQDQETVPGASQESLQEEERNQAGDTQEDQEKDEDTAEDANTSDGEQKAPSQEEEGGAGGDSDAGSEEESEDEESREYIKEAQKALDGIAAQEPLMALVYLCESYSLKESSDPQSGNIAKIPSGTTVFIKGMGVDEDFNLWYQVEAELSGRTYTGYIQREYLAYSNELFLEWEDTYFPRMAMSVSGSGLYPDVEAFPASYQDKLMRLKQAHPNWIFVKQNTNLEWTKVVSEENYKDRNLVSKTMGAAYRGDYYGQGWYYASKAAVEYFLDPRNFLDDTRVFQFEQLTYNPSYHSKAAVQNILSKTFMKGQLPKADMTYADAFYTIGISLKVSPFHLACRVYQEQGEGKSPLISGTYDAVPEYRGYYNYFNIGASGTTDKQVIETGLARARKEGWNTPYASLKGGAGILSVNYILRGQDTLYLQKFDVDASDGTLFTHQYMQNISAPYSESAMVKRAYVETGALDNPFVFKIPVYNNMPGAPCPVPSQTATPTPAQTPAPTAPAAPTPTAKPTATAVPTPTAKPAATAESTPTARPEASAAVSPGTAPSQRPSATKTPAASPTRRPDEGTGSTAKPTETASPAASPTATAEPTPTAEPVQTPGLTVKPTATAAPTPTAKPTATAVPTPTAKPAATAESTPTARPAASAAISPSAVPGQHPSATKPPAASPTHRPDEGVSQTPKPAETAPPTAAPADKPAAAQSPTAKPAPTATPTSQPAATAAPTAKPAETAAPTATTASATVSTAAPEVKPGAAEGTAKPAAEPKATDAPADTPRENPTVAPTAIPEATEAPGGDAPDKAESFAKTPSVNVTQNTNSAGVTVTAATPKPYTESGEKKSVSMDMSKTGMVYAQTLQQIKEQGMEVELRVGGQASWLIDGSAIEGDELGDINLGVTFGESGIPKEQLEILTENEKYIEMSLGHEGEFGFTIVLSVKLEDAEPGQYANLFYYNEAEGDFEFMCAAVVGNTKRADFEFSHASDYVIIISSETKENLIQEKTEMLKEAKARELEAQAQAKEELPAKEPKKAAAIIALILLGSIAVGIGVYLVMKRKDED